MENHRDDEQSYKEADLRADNAEERVEFCEAGWPGPRNEPRMRPTFG